MDYFEKIDKKPNEDLDWNIPERKQGAVNIIGGNDKNFKSEIRIGEFLNEKYPIETLKIILPDALKSKLPPLPNFTFLKSTESGSFSSKDELLEVLNFADFNILFGDLSKNSITGKAIIGASENSEKPLIIARDGVDLIADNIDQKLLLNENIIFFASTIQLKKLLRAVYYPKMLLMSQSLIQVAEVLHKFTLSYPVSIITLHNEQVLIAKNGEVKTLPLEKTNYSPITFWNGELVARICAINLYNPNNFIKATIFEILHT